MKLKQIREKIGLHPIMTFLILIVVTIVISGFLSFFNVQATYNQVNTSMDYTVTTETVTSLFSLSGLKYIFTNTVSNFANFTILSHLIIILIGIGIMESSGFLKTIITLLTKKAKKTTVTFVLVLMCLISSIMGDISYIIFIPLSALLFYHGKRSPIIGIIASFAALTCGSGISMFLTSVDSSLLKVTLNNAHIMDANYVISNTGFMLIMLVAIIALSYIITKIVETYIVRTVPKYEFEQTSVEEDLVLTKRQTRGLIFALGGALIYLIIFIYNIIPGLPFSGNLLDYSQSLYIDKLFSYDSFFSNGFVFIVTILFIILGLLYGIGAKTIKNNKEFCDSLGTSLNGIGKILVLIFVASTFISVFKQTNIGNVIVGSLTNLMASSNFNGFALVLLLFLISVVANIFVPSSLSKWTIIASVAVPTLMNSGISPEFAQVVFRFGESVTTGITPMLASFIIYLAYLERYNQKEKPIKLMTSIRYQLPFSILTFGVLLLIIILWFIIGLPLGIDSFVYI